MTIDSPVRSVGGLIAEVVAGSLAAELGWKPGDKLLSVNGRPLRDALDYQYRVQDDELDLLLERDGEVLHFRVAGGEPLGVRFADVVFDGVRTCRNHCLFCFLCGLPPGMRRSLYLRDDDYRLSAYVGNFVTLTNLSDEDWDRFEEQRLSPLYVSVHSTEPDLRRHLLGNPGAPAILPQLERLAALGITIHAQVVLCPGINDGVHLDRTIADLASLSPAVASIGVVPVGLTRYHRPDPALRRFTFDEARQVVRQVARWQRELRPRCGCGLVYASDEFQLLSGLPLPSARAYDGYPQLGNGIGMVRLLLDEWRRARRRWSATWIEHRHPNAYATPAATIATGVLAAPILEAIASELGALRGERLEVVTVENQFFGPEVTVSGLLTGNDFYRVLADRDLGRVLVLPRTSLDAAGRVFLDDLAPSDLAARLGVRVEFADDVRGLLAALDGA